jgi:hypothetical protein
MKVHVSKDMIVFTILNGLLCNILFILDIIIVVKQVVCHIVLELKKVQLVLKFITFPQNIFMPTHILSAKNLGACIPLRGKKPLGKFMHVGSSTC